MAMLRNYVKWMTEAGGQIEMLTSQEWDLQHRRRKWQLDEQFNVAQELLRDPHLKTKFDTALKKGPKLLFIE
jgi:hypothetical protein